MKKIKPLAIAAIFVTLLLVGWFAVSQQDAAFAQDVSTIPQSWGTCKGSIGVALVFEDQSGTIRLVTIEGKLFKTLTRSRD